MSGPRRPLGYFGGNYFTGWRLWLASDWRQEIADWSDLSVEAVMDEVDRLAGVEVLVYFSPEVGLVGVLAVLQVDPGAADGVVADYFGFGVSHGSSLLPVVWD